MKRLAFLAILFALPLIAQDQPKFGEKVNVNVVLLDAVVTDSSGHQILGLDKDDFIVKEKGVPQQVESVDYYTNRKLLNAPEEKAPFKVEQVHEDRYFIFFFDKPDDTQLWSEVTLARKAAENFVDKQMKDTDRRERTARPQIVSRLVAEVPEGAGRHEPRPERRIGPPPRQSLVTREGVVLN